MMYIFCKGIKKLSDYVTFPCDSTGDIPQSLNLSILSFSDFQFLRFYFGRSGEAVGLSAISLLAFSRIPHPVDAASHVPKSRPQIPSPHPNPAPEKLAKDAAPIPNAERMIRQQVNK